MRSQRQQKTTASIPHGRIPETSISRSRRCISRQMKKLMSVMKLARAWRQSKVEIVKTSSDAGGPARAASDFCDFQVLQPVDLRRQDEIVLGEPAGRVSPEPDRHRAVADEHVRMVLLGLGDSSDPVHKVDARHEPLEPEDLRQAE